MTEALAALTLGAAGSLHCAAMCGPLVLLVRARVAAPSTGTARYLVPGVYHAGRVSMYALAGLAAGQAGHAIAVRGGGRTLAWVAGTLLLVSAASHLGLRVPFPTGPAVGLLAPLLRACRTHCAQRPLTAAFVAGALNAGLPCGMLYAAVATAAALGHPLDAMRFMLLFGLATTPALVAVWVAGGWLTIGARRRLRFAVPIALALVALLLLARGAAPDAGGGRVHAATHAH